MLIKTYCVPTYIHDGDDLPTAVVSENANECSFLPHITLPRSRLLGLAGLGQQHSAFKMLPSHRSPYFNYQAKRFVNLMNS